MDIFWSFIISFMASVFAVFVALYIDRKRMPYLIIDASEDANTDNRYPLSHPHANERWKFYRVKISNIQFPKIFRWISRQTAENCRAKIEFYNLNKNQLFSFNGRWSSTPELPQLDHDLILKLLFPDPVTIPVGDFELLDIFVKYEKDKEGYGWNNEAYIHDWRTPQYKINSGKFLIKITINTQNGLSFNKWFKVIIEDTIKDTQILNI